MPDYIFLMHQDTIQNPEENWEPYITALQKLGKFGGGSAIGTGITVKKSGAPFAVNTPISGFIRVEAESIENAKTLLAGNPVYEAGGTVEIRELIVD